MQEYFGTVNMLIFSMKDFDLHTAVEIINSEGGLFDNLKDYVNELKELKNWSTFDIVLFDSNNGVLIVLKDNTSKFSVPVTQIQG